MNGMQGHQNGDSAWYREQNGISVEAEILRLQREVANRNTRALEGDKAVAVNQKLVDEIEKLTKQRDELLKALSDLLAVCPAEVECNNMHHPKSKRHGHDQSCPVVREYQAAVVEADRVVTSVKEGS